MKDCVLHLNTLRMGFINEIKSHIELKNLDVLELEGISYNGDNEIVSIDEYGMATIVDEFQNDYEIHFTDLSLYELASIVDFINK